MQLDSLLGAGVQVQLKKQGLATNDFVNITVKARPATPAPHRPTSARPTGARSGASSSP